MYFRSFLVVLCAVVLARTAALADESTIGTPQAMEVTPDGAPAESNYERANELINQGLWTDASVLLESAMEKQPGPLLKPLLAQALRQCAEHREGQTRLVEGKPMGNIAPYRADVVRRLSLAWTGESHCGSTISVEIARDGQVVDFHVANLCNTEQSGMTPLRWIEDTKFAPLPAWYRGKSIVFKIRLDGLEDGSAGNSVAESGATHRY